MIRFAGVDEAGRGALAGPVVASAVILPNDCSIDGLADSKKLSRKMRTQLAGQIKQHCISWSVAVGSVEEINRVNILQSTLLTMKEAIESLDVAPHHVLIDGNQLPDLALPATAVVKGDEQVPVISAASILAKVTRDEIMFDLAKVYPQYGFEKHVGYGTRQHTDAIYQYGALPIHRTGFAPVKNILQISHVD